MLGYVEKTWDQWLRSLVPSLPPYAQVIGEMRPVVAIITHFPVLRTGKPRTL